MADSGSGEKTEEPTPERLRKLRQDGNVPKSQDITAAFSFLLVFGLMGVLFSFSARAVMEFARASIAVASVRFLDFSSILYPLLLAALWALAQAAAPALAMAFLAGLVLNLAQVGFLFSTKPITPDFNRLNPVNGLKNIFNMKKVVELVKTVIKFILIGYFAYSALRDAIGDVSLLMTTTLLMGLKVVGQIIVTLVGKVSLVFLLIAIFDGFYQRRRFLKDNMMTKHDVKQEYKQSEGDPQHKAERRRMHHEILAGGGAQRVKGADVVVRNPHQIAVALKYESGSGKAPEIVAKGERIWAEKILEAADLYGVPVVRNVPLAQALNKLDVNDEIPEELYQAVAEVLNFVYTLAEEQKRKRGGVGGGK